ncbi:hypothetical protein DSM106972_092030 [Dulcicalothrix desertica PCC 7102]|uniref:Uncharacterized protein n=1 Tax=Dulcicalothrix desertica PCC 7102 TaxID=232991 RepID=A0A433UM88_9CYAN|nr:hypothetical protein [Dulcicalothrix desertica]RUS94952.1 hypothetical protein DSM106972_092030 [Dulcicalothrix desertica PCC 7102]TWH62812.1 hypothetical protein CAL7102_00342 [Dulcicalothrix desertica PCC 7102]
MTDASNPSQEVYTLLAELTRRQLQTDAQIERTQAQIERTQEQLENTQYEVRSLSNDVTRVLGRSAVLDEVLLELRDSHETMRQNFTEHQRTTNAALNSLEAILLRLIDIINRDLN